jgi:hypothetical protein
LPLVLVLGLSVTSFCSLEQVYESAGMSADGELSGYPQTWEQIDGDNYIAGGFYWTGFDYKGEPAYDMNINSQFGILDIAGFPKDSWYDILSPP